MLGAWPSTFENVSVGCHQVMMRIDPFTMLPWWDVFPLFRFLVWEFFPLLPQHGLRPAGKQLRRGCLICKKFADILLFGGVFSRMFPQSRVMMPQGPGFFGGVENPPAVTSNHIFRSWGASPWTSDDGPAQRQELIHRRFKVEDGVNGWFPGNQWVIILEFPLLKSKINRWYFVIDLFLRYHWAPRLVCVWIRIILIFLNLNQSYRGGWMAFPYDRWGDILERQNRQQHCVAIPNDEFDPSKGLGTYTALIDTTFVSSFCRSKLF